MLWLHAFALAGMLMPAGPGTDGGRSESRPAISGDRAAPVRDGSAPLPSVRPDPVGNGIALGALIGGVVAVAFTAAEFARCDAGCEAPRPLPTYTLAAGIGAGIGAVTGWLIDRARRPRPSPARTMAVAAFLSSRQKGLALALRF